MSRLIFGDNTTVMRELYVAGTRAHCIYADPPFNTGRDFHFARAPYGFEKKPPELAFSDRWPSFDVFIATLQEQAMAARDLLVEDGCLVVHVDPKIGAEVHWMLVNVFGARCDRHSVAWKRTEGSHGNVHGYAPVHDTLLFFVKTPGSTRVPDFTQHEVGNLWTDVPCLNPRAKERTGYPTQKPEALLERILLLCSAPGETVVDPFAGSGTTVAVATRLGRVGIGIDRSTVAARVASARLGVDARPWR